MDLSYTQAVKKRRSIMIIDDNTNPKNAFCGNITGMCCDNDVRSQKEILRDIKLAYQAEGQEISAIDESSFAGTPVRLSRKNSGKSPVLDRIKD